MVTAWDFFLAVGGLDEGVSRYFGPSIVVAALFS